MATSSDGLTWAKSDERVLTAEADWEGLILDRPRVARTPDGFVMLYAGGTLTDRGVAWSDDGVTWTRDGDAPAITAEDFPVPGQAMDAALIHRDGELTYYLEIGFGAGREREPTCIGRRRNCRSETCPGGLVRETGATSCARTVKIVFYSAATADPLFGEGISYAILSGVVAAQSIGDWASGPPGDLRRYSARLREGLGPALRRLGRLAGLIELSMPLSLAAVRLSRQVREQAVDVIAGATAAQASG